MPENVLIDYLKEEEDISSFFDNLGVTPASYVESQDLEQTLSRQPEVFILNYLISVPLSLDFAKHELFHCEKSGMQIVEKIPQLSQSEVSSFHVTNHLDQNKY